ncbi:hypothetical protein CRUP_006467 [Coryphaenoides rupestris]|nr:hypothetical protein CRUP_006467 [Coryphaenoides rupestris]
MRSKGRARKLATSDGDNDFTLYASDILEQMCSSDGDPAPPPPPPSALADDPPSPLASGDETSAPEERPPSYRHPEVYMHGDEEEEEEEEVEEVEEEEDDDDEDLHVPPDFELRESSVPGAGLGVWSVVRLENGERFGPYKHVPRPRDRTHGYQQISDGPGHVKFCADASKPDTGSWLKHIQFAPLSKQHNLTACQIDDQRRDSTAAKTATSTLSPAHSCWSTRRCHAGCPTRPPPPPPPPPPPIHTAVS